jgi:hypothetical protein
MVKVVYNDGLYKEGLTMFRSTKRIIVFLSMILMFTLLFSSNKAFAEEDYTDGETDDVSEDTAEEDSEEASDDQDEASKERADLGGYKGLVAHWKFDGDLTDSSKFKNDGVAVGGKSGVTFVDSVVGKGVKLDGKSYIEVKDSDSLDLSKAFTFSFWVYKDDSRKKDEWDGGIPYIIKSPDEWKEIPYGVYEWWRLTPGFTYFDEEYAGDIHSEKQLDIQKWSLISVTYDGKTMKIYRDKELVKSELKDVVLARSFNPLYIGFGHFMNTDNYFKGVLDDMRIYNQALTYSEIEDLYDDAAKGSGKNLVHKPDRLVAYYKFEDNLKDLSLFKNDGAAIKANNFKYIDGMAGKAIKFNGASYIEVKDSDSLDLDQGFTFGMWIYKEKSKNNQPIFSKYGESHNKKEASYSLLYWNESFDSDLTLSDFEEGGDSFQDRMDGGSAASDGRWFYYTATYQGSDDNEEASAKDTGTLKQYINGKLVKSQEFDSSIAHSSGPLWIGGSTNGAYFKGRMDEFRIYNYALTPTQVKELYNMRDRLEVNSVDKKAKFSSLKAKQTIQLEVNLLTHLFTPSGNEATGGKDELKKQEVTSKATFKSNNTKVAAVSEKGVLTTTGNGKAKITVTYGNYSQELSIVVK